MVARARNKNYRAREGKKSSNARKRTKESARTRLKQKERMRMLNGMKSARSRGNRGNNEGSVGRKKKGGGKTV